MKSGLLKKFLPFLVLIALFIFLAVVSPVFLTGQNLSSVVRQTAVINIMALGMTMVIIAGGIDLSVGSILAFAGVVGTMALSKGSPIMVGILAGILAGALCGFLNGFLTTKLKVNPFIVTLGALLIVRGVTLIIANGMPIHQVPKGFSYLAEGVLFSTGNTPETQSGGIPFLLLVLLGCAMLVHVILEYTKLGRYGFAIGSNPDAAYYAGIGVGFHTMAIYAICGGLTGLAGMIEASRLMTGQPTAGQGYELSAIAAVVIGGGSLRGGEGGVVGTLIGAFIMGLLANGCDLLGIQPFVQQAIIGAVIIVAVSFDEFRKRKLA